MCAAQLLGFDNFIPPFAATSGDQLLGGANFASAAAGIRAETGQQLGGRIPFAGQVQNYQTAVQTLVGILGDQDTASDHLSRCIFSVGMGSNDYLNNYFMPAFYNTGSRYTPEQYADSLIADYRRYLQVLYNYGARKVVLIGVGQVGCSPNELARYSADGVTCVDRIDGAIQIFNRRLVGLVDEFNALPGAHFTYINAYNIFDDILANAASYGTVANAALMTIYFRFPCWWISGPKGGRRHNSPLNSLPSFALSSEVPTSTWAKEREHRNLRRRSTIDSLQTEDRRTGKGLRCSLLITGGFVSLQGVHYL
jgi:hypothetical protein